MNTPAIAAPVPLLVVLPIRTKNASNMRVPNSRVAAIAIRAGDAKQRDEARKVVEKSLERRREFGPPLPQPPFVVTLTRLSPGSLDDGGIVSSLKRIEDGVALALGVDDGDRERVLFRFFQRKCDRGAGGVEVLIERGPTCRPGGWGHSNRCAAHVGRLLVDGVCDGGRASVAR